LPKFENAAGILDRGIQLDGLGMKSFMTYESNVLFALRFMIDCNIVGGNWIEVPVGKYKKTTKSLSYCQLEFDCLYPFSDGNIKILCLR
jgi:DNA polymerase delta subunit 1